MASRVSDFPKPYQNNRWVWPTTMSKPEWGPRAWNWLHGFAIRYPQEPSREARAIAYARLMGFIQSLPCDECRNHALAYIKAQPLDMSNTYALQRWMWTFHNAVNFRLKKRMVPYEEYQRLYADEISRMGYTL